MDAREPIRAAGEVGGLERDGEDHLGQREREHEEEDAERDPHGEDDRRADDSGAAHRPMRTRPSSPVGRKSRTRAMIAKIKARANCGNRTLPNVSAGPTTALPATAPDSEPSPPTTTTMSE